MSPSRDIWVLPEISDSAGEIVKLSCGLLSEARYIAGKVDGAVTALVFGDSGEAYPEVLGQYGVSRVVVFKHPLFKYLSAEVYASALFEKINRDKPWLVLMGNTLLGRELTPLLAVLLDAGVIPGYVKIDLDHPEKPLFFRPVLGEQAYQQIVFQSDRTMLATVDPGVLDISPCARATGVKIEVIEPELDAAKVRVQHLAFLPADYATVDVADADVIVGAGAGAVSGDLFPLVEELARLVEGAIGTTRPVVDEGKIDRERLIGQTGKTVGPEFYLALGISGSSHHVGGIQESKKIVSVNRDAGSPIFQGSDVGVVADLKDVLPRLIKKIKQAGRDE